MQRTKLADRVLPNYTKGEEIFNMTSHIVGGVFATAALTLCVAFAAAHGNVWGVVSGAIYGVTMILLYTMSSIYHGLSPKWTATAKKVFQVIDHCSIYFLIAGTYTPITLCAVRPINETLGWTIFGVVWAMAALGVTLTAIDLKKYRIFSMVSYLGMGWCIIVAFGPMVDAFGWGPMALLLAGGAAYTVGAVLYGLGKKIRYMHSVFHLFVLAGSILQLLMILMYLM
ncbi:MAG: PAQR family membrane homeostasis protein TrhA [Eubacteriales bacterium]